MCCACRVGFEGIASPRLLIIFINRNFCNYRRKCISWGGFIVCIKLGCFFFLLVVRHFGVRIVYFMVWGEASDVHDVKDTIFRAYDGLRWVETFRRLDRFFG